MHATLTKNGTGCSIGDPRSYDAWGNILSGSGDPKGRYCASLGHKQDDESGLTYMRARYYEATSGRFVSEDPDNEGNNWFAYCGDEPAYLADCSGREGEPPNLVELLEMLFKTQGYSLPKNIEDGALLYACVVAAEAYFEAAFALADLADAALDAGAIIGAFSPAGAAYCTATGLATGLWAMVYCACGMIAIYNAACAVDLVILDSDG